MSDASLCGWGSASSNAGEDTAIIPETADGIKHAAIITKSSLETVFVVRVILFYW
jgi:hypothetical protein